MKAVYKYNLPANTPKGDILHIGNDPSGELCAWVLVDPDDTNIVNSIHVAGTGVRYEDAFFERATHLKTFNDGPFMWHIFVEELPSG